MEHTTRKISTLVDLVQRKQLRLPEIQRNYVWKRAQVRDLIDSLYRDYPTGAILVWETDATPNARLLSGQEGQAPDDHVSFVLDGQQRITSLWKLFDEDDEGIDIRFNIETQEFAVADAAIKRDPRYIHVSEILKQGAMQVMQRCNLFARPDVQEVANRLNRVERIKEYTYPVYILRNHSYEEVTEIFVRVNSKGTRLRQAELALAQLAYRIPGIVADEFEQFLDDMAEQHYEFEVKFLVRCLAAVATDQSKFGQLQAKSEAEIRDAWVQAKAGIGRMVALLKNNLGVDTLEWLPSVNALVVPVLYLARTPGPEVERDRLLQWFVLASIWGRYGGSSETTLNEDFAALRSENPFEKLLGNLKQVVGRLDLTEQDFEGATVNSPLMLGVFLACRAAEAEDWWHPIRIASTGVGEHSLQIHHIFPKATLRSTYTRRQINELANLAFLTQKANVKILKSLASDYLPKIASGDQKKLSRQFVPLDAGLWNQDRFPEFLKSRRQLLAGAVNELTTQMV